MNDSEPVAPAQGAPPTHPVAVVSAPVPQPPRHAPDFDALAASFGALSVAIAFGSAIVGMLAIVVTIAWNFTTKAAAIAAAREEAERRVAAFLREEAPQRVERAAREHLAASMTNTGVVSTRGVAEASSDADAVSASPEE